MMPSGDLDLLNLTARIVAAHVEHNQVSADDLPGLIRSVHDTLRTVSEPAIPPEPTLVPAVPVKKSIQREFLVCLEDGKKLKTLKRHLLVSFGLTPDAYRAKWGLPTDYPMVAPAYAEARSEIAKRLGLGRKRPAPPPAAPPRRPTRKPSRRSSAKS